MFPILTEYCNSRYNIILGFGVISAVAVVVYNIVKKSHRGNETFRIVKNWKPVGIVSGLNIYPVKSFHRLEVEEADCGKLGIYNEEFHDRSFMVVNENNNFLHARKYPAMVMIKVSKEQDEVKFTSPTMESIIFSIPSNSDASETRIVKVWGEKVAALDCGDEIALWLSQQIFGNDSGARLVYYPYSYSPRQVKTSTSLPWLKETDGSIFSDLSPYHLLSKESVEDLNLNIDSSSSVLPLNFRPNIIVTGCSPYAEDEWRYIKIGENATFRFVKHCTRCLMTNVDPLTGIKNPESEPLVTLQKYRQAENYDSPIFGIDLALEVGGKIHVGDVVYMGQ